MADATTPPACAETAGDTGTTGLLWTLASPDLAAGQLDRCSFAYGLLGDGVRLIDAWDLGPVRLERNLVATSGQFTDLRFAVRRSG